jgi:nicotinamide riboside kinase
MEENLKQLQNTGSSKIIKIALFGPESTGKTTLAIQLAEHFKTAWVPEFARDYLQEKWDKTAQICDVDDMLPIAYGQTKLENDSLSIANNYLFCDTNLMVTKVFSEVYYGYCDPILDKAALNHEYDLFFLTDIDVPWEKDDLRDKPEGRESVFAVFKQTLIDTNKPFIRLSGDKDSRLSHAVSIINDLTLAKQMGFSSLDFVQIHKQGVSLEDIQKQLNIFKNGISKVDLIEPATALKGISKLSENDFQQKASFFEENKSNLKLTKFVPASGAASRMFKFLTTFLNEFDIENESINAYINRKKESELSIFIVGMEKFPFFNAIDSMLKHVYPDFNLLTRDHKNYYFIQLLLSPDYFDFANKPKGILPFHKYVSHIATAINEHLYECAFYSSSNGNSHLHLTVSEAHQIHFESIINSVKSKIEKESETIIAVSYSYQNKATDSIAVSLDNNPFRDENNKLVFRPGGHGALIENLNNLDADIIFIKNIDNVIQNRVESNALYKKALAGILIELQQQIFSYLDQIENSKETFLDEIVAFAKRDLNLDLPLDFSEYTLENKFILLKDFLDRPIRVCGMVKNEGEPGGGPYWVRDLDGTISLQIVETSQIDLLNANQVKILADATHFNPVDLVCGIRNYKDEKFDLTQFIDANSGFIVEKNKEGKPLKGYELPGLWNGAMAKWLTIFVEVPLMTFNPVKTVNDLLKPAHQPQ